MACPWSCACDPPLHPLSKLLAIQDHTQNVEEQLWIGGRREVSIIFYRPVTRSDLKQERSFFRGSVSSFLQLVVACSSRHSDRREKSAVSSRFIFSFALSQFNGPSRSLERRHGLDTSTKDTFSPYNGPLELGFNSPGYSRNRSEVSNWALKTKS